MRPLVAIGPMLASIVCSTALGAAALDPQAGKPPPPPPPEPVEWTAGTIAQSITWEAAEAAAAAHEEGGFDDWRLPTPEEAEAAINDGSWGTNGTSNGSVSYWTSERRGNWAWRYSISFDNGVPIPESLEIERVWWPTSFLDVRAVRP